MSMPVRAETPNGEVTVLTIIDVVPNCAMPHDVRDPCALSPNCATTFGERVYVNLKQRGDEPGDQKWLVLLGRWIVSAYPQQVR
jgi:hypothetical protein